MSTEIQSDDVPTLEEQIELIRAAARDNPEMLEGVTEYQGIPIEQILGGPIEAMSADAASLGSEAPQAAEATQDAIVDMEIPAGIAEHLAAIEGADSAPESADPAAEPEVAAEAHADPAATPEVAAVSEAEHDDHSEPLAIDPENIILGIPDEWFDAEGNYSFFTTDANGQVVARDVPPNYELPVDVQVQFLQAISDHINNGIAKEQEASAARQIEVRQVEAQANYPPVVEHEPVDHDMLDAHLESAESAGPPGAGEGEVGSGESSLLGNGQIQSELKTVPTPGAPSGLQDNAPDVDPEVPPFAESGRAQVSKPGQIMSNGESEPSTAEVANLAVDRSKTQDLFSDVRPTVHGGQTQDAPTPSAGGEPRQRASTSGPKEGTSAGAAGSRGGEVAKTTDPTTNLRTEENKKRPAGAHLTGGEALVGAIANLFRRRAEPASVSTWRASQYEAGDRQIAETFTQFQGMAQALSASTDPEERRSIADRMMTVAASTKLLAAQQVDTIAGLSDPVARHDARSRFHAQMESFAQTSNALKQTVEQHHADDPELLARAEKLQQAMMTLLQNLMRRLEQLFGVASPQAKPANERPSVVTAPAAAQFSPG